MPPPHFLVKVAQWELLRWRTDQRLALVVEEGYIVVCGGLKCHLFLLLIGGVK